MKLGMSSLGVATYTPSEETYVKPYSQQTESAIDLEIDKIINECAVRCKELVHQHKEKIEK